jgi:small-conductance mechanosensitive channel
MKLKTFLKKFNFEQREIIVASILFVTAILFWIFNLRLNLEIFYKIYSSLFVIGGFSLLLAFVDGLIIRKIDYSSSSYFKVRKSFKFIIFLIAGLFLFQIWLQNLVIAYSLFAAGLAVALQDVFKNLAGGFFIYFNNVFKVGDRIQVDRVWGDVIDINFMNTSLLEIQNWVEGDQATGRIINLPNSVFITHETYNYTKDHDFIWDEISIPVKYGSDWKQAMAIIKEIIADVSDKYAGKSSKDLEKIQKKYYVANKSLDSNAYVNLTDNWILISGRYITNAKERRITKNTISLRLLDRFKEAGIEVASQTFEVVGLPDIKLKMKKD